MKLVVELPDTMKRTIRRRDDGTLFIDLTLIPRWYDIEIVEVWSEPSPEVTPTPKPKKNVGRPKKTVNNDTTS